MKKLKFLFTAIILALALVAVQTSRAASFTVVNTNDSGAGSLRQAILDANANADNNNTINFDNSVFNTPQTIVLTSGQLVIQAGSNFLKSLTINGPGADKLTVSGNYQSRVLKIDVSAKAIINSLKIAHGNGTDNGAIPGSDAVGGGISVSGGSVTGDERPNLYLSNSIVSDNKCDATDFSTAGGISALGKVTIVNSAIINNLATSIAGAIRTSGKLTIVNTTISGNVSRLAGAINLNNGDLSLINSTLVYNSSTNWNGIGGIWVSPGSFGIFEARNSIIAKNTGAQNAGMDISGTLQAGGNNIIGNTFGSFIVPGMTGNQLNVDPQLDLSLNYNGGVIPSHALSTNSPALDMGSNCVLTTTANGGCVENALSQDVRGIARPQDADGNGTATVDVGAIETTRNEILLAPSVAPDLDAASDSGVSDADNITKNTTLTFNVGGVANGATVDLLRNGVTVASGTASGNSIIFTQTNVADGVYQYTSRQTVDGSASLQSLPVSVKVDTAAPITVIYQPPAQNDPTGVLPVNLAVFFNEPVTDFNASDISLAGSTANVSQAVVSVAEDDAIPGTYNVFVNNITGAGTVFVNFPANAAQDLAGNSSPIPTITDNSVTLDFTPPTVTINQAATQAEPTNLMPVAFTVVFSEAVTGFDGADVSLAGSTANIATATKTVMGSGTTYTVFIGGITSNGGFVRATILPQSSFDSAGNGNIASTSTDNTVTVDNFAPRVTINQAAGQPDPASNLPVNYTIVFNEAVTGLDASDFSLSNSTAVISGLTYTITGSGAVYNLAVGGNFISTAGQLRISILAGAAADSTGNQSIASTSTDNTVTLSSKRGFADFDGDGKTDVGIFRPSDGSWWYSRSSDNAFRVFSFGASTDVITPGDYSGDGKTDIAVFRPQSGEWFIQRSEDNSFYSFPFGTPGDVPVPADFDGDGKVDVAVFRPSTGTWFILNSGGSGTSIVNFGSAEDKPVQADFDGDGKADIAIFRPSDGSWWYLQSTNSQFKVFRFGLGTDKPVQGDYTGDGKADLAIWRPSTGEWFFQRSEDNSYYSVPFGALGDLPTPGDYDGDGKFDTAVFRPATANWFVQRSSAGILITSFGASGDRPIANAYIP